MKRLLILTLLAGLPFASLAAPTPEERAQAVAETRQGLFKVIVAYFGPVVGMARGQIPYDGAEVARAAEKIGQLAPMIPDMLRNDTRAFDLETEALPAIWDNLDDIATKAGNLRTAAGELQEAAGQNQEAAMAAFRSVGGACKACHDEYRVQN